MNKFYTTIPFHKRIYLIPTYLSPLIGYFLSSCTTHYFQITVIFTLVIQLLLFLSAQWFITLRRIFTLKSSSPEKAEIVLHEGKEYCTIINNIYEYKKQFYVIEDRKCTLLQADTARPFSYFTQEGRASFLPPSFRSHYPLNTFDITPPSFLTLFKEHAVQPFFVFQMFCGLLWCLDEYIYHSLFSIFMLISFEMGVVFQRLKNIQEFRTMNLKRSHVKLIHSDNTKKDNITDSLYLTPGDIIVLDTPGIQVPCDLLILKGSCAVNEAMLTGESTPFTKEEIPKEDAVFNMAQHHKHVLFGGTTLIVLDGPVTCFVLETGFGTKQGELVRKMMCTDEVIDNTEAYLFIGVLLIFAILASVYTYREGVRIGKSGYKIALEVIMVITNVVPPELPLELTIAVNASLQNLITRGVFCLEPFRIPYAGKIDVCCFDKTGTLTESELSVKRIISENGDTRMIDSLAVCHSLININNVVQGDPIEKSVFEYFNFTLKNHVVKYNDKAYQVLKKYSFTSELRRMSVVGKCDGSVFVAMKGAPEVVKSYLRSIPNEYDNYKKYAIEGYRVIAVGYKSYKKQVSYQRDHVESNLDFLGFVLYECKIKDESVECVNALIKSGHRIVMITGDNVLTSECVAKKLGFYNGVSVEGDDIDKCLMDENDSFDNISVFARANPQHKEQIINKYKKMGLMTLMCGDGTNDVGALKAAHVGVALVDGKFVEKKPSQNIMEDPKISLGDASVAAPFTAKTGSIKSIKDIILLGRSALVTTIQMYKILALNSLITAYSLSVLDALGVRYSDIQLTVSGVLIALAFMFLTRSKPLPDISKERPVGSIFHPYIIFSTILQTIVHISSFYLVIKSVKDITPEIVLEDRFKPSLMNSALFLLSTYQQISTFIVNYIGRPFRESLIENGPLRNSLILISLFVITLILEINPDFNLSMEIVSLGNIRSKLIGVIIGDLILCYIIEWMCFKIFLLNK
ncbi:putative manganese-transporting ATPase PDR2 [Astathelohania contejeani]|uniref:Manganese-transporting ATPase PDR2 n=1 Tax=Astathelohania contejeani TaxID=164912 RepID=A0ABQ7HWV1_9MICR|nr:putative manganese-transporting ATPase PDR2 [Thelohania contejeani]